MYELSPETKRAISEAVGLPWETLTNMTVEEEIAYIEKKNGKKLGFAMRPYSNIRLPATPCLIVIDLQDKKMRKNGLPSLEEGEIDKICLYLQLRFCLASYCLFWVL